ncbi:hypothetical protein [Roseofilum capinflatum]|uniref:Uncharacterized protein n=1 Tax=Roseofilum capinflatum BLCC-M114 TaxID=3022440 RepID=A0ABT7B5P7_9CYAN|nr:hypothetical protein [Roseofilum capinflatum]MDJ1173856.1 hypothetical protein [Roseofilum capinflatum BLCC-M114]
MVVLWPNPAHPPLPETQNDEYIKHNPNGIVLFIYTPTMVSAALSIPLDP